MTKAYHNLTHENSRIKHNRSKEEKISRKLTAISRLGFGETACSPGENALPPVMLHSLSVKT